jgi:hypothetical protein
VFGRVNPAGVGYAVYGENNNHSGYAGYFHGDVTVTGIFSNPSDERLKKNVKPIDGALGQLLKLRGVTFEWKDPDSYGGAGTQQGFIAQEVEKVFPHWVTTGPDGFKTLSTRGLEPMLLESVRQLKLDNDSLRDRVKALEARRVASAATFGGDGITGLAGLALAGAVVLLRRRGSR